MNLDPSLKSIVLVAMGGYVVLAFALAAYAQRRVQSVEDYVVAGRRLPLWLATPTLLATWFGAGTLMTATDEVRQRGISAATLDPIGAGLCLVIAAFVIAKPLWAMKLTTLSDFYRIRFDRRVEQLSAVMMVPSYFGWIAAQFMVLAEMLELFGGIPIGWGLVLVAFVGVGYTLMGGMWAVTLTDAAQMVIVVVGLVLLTATVLGELGDGALDGIAHVWSETSAERRSLIEPAFLPWLSVLCAGALGNLPMQDVGQRIFASRSARVAQLACLIAGVSYLVLGVMPILLGLAANSIGTEGESTLSLLAAHFLTPGMAVLFVLVLMSVILSTIDSAILAPATVISQNLVLPRMTNASPLRVNRIAVLVVGVISLGVSFAGESAYELLEAAYELGMVSLLVPLLFGLTRWRSPAAALGAMIGGFAAWLAHLLASSDGFLGTQMPVGLMCMALAATIYVVVYRIRLRRRRGPRLRARPSDTSSSSEAGVSRSDARARD